MPRPQNAMEIFKLLDKSNCRDCGEKTCLAFAGAVYQGRKKIQGLETVEFQMDLFESMTAEEGEKFLLYTLQEIDQEKKYLNDIVAYWARGDVAPIEKILTEIFESQPELENINRKLLDDRNRGMVETIEALLGKDQIHFIVVGAAHLIGEEGIIEILERKGYRLRQL